MMQDQQQRDFVLVYIVKDKTDDPTEDSLCNPSKRL